DLNMSIDETNVLILKDQIRKIIAFYIEKNSNIDNPKLKIDQIDGKYLNILADFKNMFGMCDAGINSFNFMPDGNVYPCSFLTNLKEFCIGDIYNGISIEKSRELAIKNFDINKNIVKYNLLILLDFMKNFLFKNTG
ncbi:MAG: SPASM domain-containing protein, partial [Clostridium celatum]|nr:SPASM domain-containing protein [Clostridium celatum]